MHLQLVTPEYVDSLARTEASRALRLAYQIQLHQLVHPTSNKIHSKVTRAIRKCKWGQHLSIAWLGFLKGNPFTYAVTVERTTVLLDTHYIPLFIQEPELVYWFANDLAYQLQVVSNGQHTCQFWVDGYQIRVEITYPAM